LKLLRRLIIIFLILLCVYLLGINAVKIVYPLKYYGIIAEKAQKYGLDVEFVCAMIRTESRFNENAVSGKDAYGLMQLTENTARWGADETGLLNFSNDMLFTPDVNIDLGCWYIRKLIDQYGGDYNLALAAYNGGSGNVAKWLSDKDISPDGKTLTNIPFRETREFIERVNKSAAVYKYLIKFKDLIY